jgi:hypothetical protein
MVKVLTWAETVRRAQACTEIIDKLTRFLPPDSGITPASCLSDIIRIIEVRTDHRFLQDAGYEEREPSKTS